MLHQHFLKVLFLDYMVTCGFFVLLYFLVCKALHFGVLFTFNYKAKHSSVLIIMIDLYAEGVLSGLKSLSDMSFVK